MPYDFIELKVGDKVADLTLNRPPANLLHIPMMEEINDAMLSLRRYGSLQVLVVRGGKDDFSLGLDLEEHVPGRVRRLLQVFMRMFETIRMMNLISVAAVEGRAHGAGFELALGCNLIVAADSADFALPQLRDGLIPPLATAVLPRIAPRRKAMEWILTGNTIPVKRLEHDGVINRVVPASSFEQDLRSFVGQLTDKSGPVLQLAKRAQFEAYYSAFPDALASIQTLYIQELMNLQDAKEGPKAARENREPVWQHC
jgi:enoyl-CoA hydratase/carnithine racemase